MAACIIVGLVVWMLKPATPKPVTRFTISLPPGQRLDLGLPIAISPDGTRLVYSAGSNNVATQLYIRAMDGLQAAPVPETEGAHNPFFSPNGQWIGFNAADGKLKKVSLSGGASVNLTDITAGQLSGTSWGSQEIIAVAPQTSGPIYQIPETGGNLEPLTRLEKTESGHRWPELLPGGKGLLFMLAPNNNPKIVAQTLGTNEHRDLQQAGIFPRYALSGHLVYFQGSNLIAVPFDPQRLPPRAQRCPSSRVCCQLGSAFPLQERSFIFPILLGREV